MKSFYLIKVDETILILYYVIAPLVLLSMTMSTLRIGYSLDIITVKG
jgi:hypothetical protein